MWVLEAEHTGWPLPKAIKMYKSTSKGDLKGSISNKAFNLGLAMSTECKALCFIDFCANSTNYFLTLSLCKVQFQLVVFSSPPNMFILQLRLMKAPSHTAQSKIPVGDTLGIRFFNH